MSVGRNASYNMIGFLIPTLLALLTVPAYLALIGVARYGVLALAWAVLGYFGVFDLGLGRATAQRLAFLRDSSPQERSTALHTALRVNAAIGTCGAVMLYPVGRFLFGEVMTLEPALRAEALAALPLLSLTLPIATTMGVLSGALMGRARFLDANKISVSSTVLLQLFPLGVAWIATPALPAILAAAIAARLAAAALLYRAARSEFGAGARRWDSREMRRLLTFGGWVTVTSAIGPLLNVIDRFVIGALIGPVAVTIYTVPMDAAARIGGVSAAVGNALFPRLALASGEESDQLVRKAVGALYAILTPTVAAAIVLMDPALRLWLGEAIGGTAAPIARLLVLAWWLNALAQMPFARLLAQGRPDVLAKLHLLEAPIYLGLLWFGVTQFGLLGAAYAFLARVAADGIAVSLLAGGRVERGATVALSLTALLLTALSLGLAPERQSTAGALAGATVAASLAALPAWLVAPEKAREMCSAKFRQIVKTLAS